MCICWRRLTLSVTSINSNAVIESETVYNTSCMEQAHNHQSDEGKWQICVSMHFTSITKWPLFAIDQHCNYGFADYPMKSTVESGRRVESEMVNTVDTPKDNAQRNSYRKRLSCYQIWLSIRMVFNPHEYEVLEIRFHFAVMVPFDSYTTWMCVSLGNMWHNYEGVCRFDTH